MQSDLAKSCLIQFTSINLHPKDYYAYYNNIEATVLVSRIKYEYDLIFIFRWYHGSLSRIEAENLLRSADEGAFLVRNSESTKHDYSLSLK